jgi:acyl-coenzyme A thioesterase 13
MVTALSVKDRINALLRYCAGVDIDSGDSDGSIGFDITRLAEVELLSTNQNKLSVRYSFRVTARLCNRGRNLHGGAASTLFDTLTSLVLLTLGDMPQWDTLGVSRNLSVTFLRPIPIGTKVFLDCDVIAAGKRLANLSGTMKDDDGKIYATCTHDKVGVGGSNL